MVKAPFSDETASKAPAVASFLRLTVAPGRIAPDESTIVPDSDEVAEPPWAKAGRPTVTVARRTSADTSPRELFLIETSSSPASLRVLIRRSGGLGSTRRQRDPWTRDQTFGGRLEVG